MNPTSAAPASAIRFVVGHENIFEAGAPEREIFDRMIGQQPHHRVRIAGDKKLDLPAVPRFDRNTVERDQGLGNRIAKSYRNAAGVPLL